MMATGLTWRPPPIQKVAMRRRSEMRSGPPMCRGSRRSILKRIISRLACEPPGGLMGTPSPVEATKLRRLSRRSQPLVLWIGPEPAQRPQSTPETPNVVTSRSMCRRSGRSRLPVRVIKQPVPIAGLGHFWDSAIVTLCDIAISRYRVTSRDNKSLLQLGTPLTYRLIPRPLTPLDGKGPLVRSQYHPPEMT